MSPDHFAAAMVLAGWREETTHRSNAPDIHTFISPKGTRVAAHPDGSVSLGRYHWAANKLTDAFEYVNAWRTIYEDFDINGVRIQHNRS